MIIFLILLAVFVLMSFSKSTVESFRPAQKVSTLKSDCTLVTAYYEVPGKHNPSKFNEWIYNFFGQLDHQCQIVVFTTGAIKKRLEGFAFDRPNMKIQDYPLEQFRMAKFREAFEYQQRNFDPEASLHTVELYMIWNEKPHFVTRAIELNAFPHSTHYAWLDIGMVRDSHLASIFVDFPRPSGLAFLKAQNKLCFLALNDGNLSKFEKLDQSGVSIVNKKPHTLVCVGGGCFFGKKEDCIWFSNEFQRLFELYLHNNWFVGKDQNLFANIIAVHQKRFTLLKPFHQKCWLDQFQTNLWFSMLNVFAGNESERPIHFVSLNSGLGNQLFQLAAVYGIARKRGELCVISRSILSISPHNLKANYPKTIFRRFLQKLILFAEETYSNEDSHAYDESLITAPAVSSKKYINSYFQNFRYFQQYLNELRNLLVFPETPIYQGTFLHLRFGDYVKNRDHWIDLEKYFKRCLQKANARKIFVFSNDNTQAKEYVQNKLKLRPDSYELMPKDKDEIMALSRMSHCIDGGICSNSTFSWWGAILNPNPQKQIFYPRRQYPKESRYAHMDVSGLFHPAFTIVDVD